MRRGSVVGGVAALIVFAVCVVQASRRVVPFPELPGLPPVAVHHNVFIDEPGWISAALASSHRLLTGDLAPSDWNDTDLNEWGDVNPPGAKLLIGLSLTALYGGSPPAFHALYDSGLTQSQNAAAGNNPPWPLLVRARLICCVISGLVCVLVFIFAATVDGVLTGLLTTAFLLMTALFTFWSYHVVTDGVYLLASLGAGLAGLAYLRSADVRTARRWLVAAGLLVGFAASVKVTALIPLALFMLLLILRAAAREAPAGRSGRGAGRFGLFLLAAIVLIYGINPSYWPDTRHIDLPAARAEAALLPAVLSEARDHPAIPDITVRTLRKRCPHLYALMRPLGYPMMTLRWKEIAKAQSLDPGTPPWKGFRPADVTLNLLRDYQAFRKEFFVILAGLALLVVRFRQRRGSEEGDAAFVMLSFLGAQYALLLLIPLNFDRYYLCCTIGTQFLAAFAIVCAVRGAVRIGRAGLRV